MIDKEIIARNFSRSARFYDSYADIQLRAALELLGQVKGKKPSRILEIGCGTGNYTLLLRRQYRDASLRAVDVSEKMIEVAREKLKDEKVDFSVVGYGQKYEPGQVFDLITSNACFQWFEDLESALLEYKNMLNENGMITFSVFGPLTFRELNSSLKKISGGISVEAKRFKTALQIKKILLRNFKKINIKEKIYVEHYPDLASLLRKIKYTGIRGSGLKGKKAFSRGTLDTLEKLYLKKFSVIKTTYQVFFCRVFKA